MAIFGTKRIEELEEEVAKLQREIQFYKENHVSKQQAREFLQKIKSEAQTKINQLNKENLHFQKEKEDLHKRINHLEDAVVRWKWKYERDIEEREQSQSFLVTSKDYDGEYLTWQTNLPFPSESPSWHVHSIVQDNKLKYGGHIFTWFEGKKLISYIEAREIFKEDELHLKRVSLKSGKWWAYFQVRLSSFQLEEIEERIKEKGILQSVKANKKPSEAL